MRSRRPGLTGDARLLVAGQGVRAAGYGFTAVLLGVLLAARGFTSVQVGVVLTALIAGTALASLAVGRFGDRFGRRRSYAVFFGGIAVAGVVVAAGAPLWVLLVVALTGTLFDRRSGQRPGDHAGAGDARHRRRGHGRGVWPLQRSRRRRGRARLAGGDPSRAWPAWDVRGVHAWLFLVLVPVGITGAILAARLSPAVEASPDKASTLGPVTRARTRLGPSRGVVRRLAGLFAVDAAGGGLVTTGFLSYYFAERYHVSVVALGWLFFAVSVVQAISVALAPLLARRFGLIATMVGTHLPSNVLLAAVAFAPTFPVAAVLLLARTTLSQMDVPTRQALVMTVVTPGERTAAAAVTNASRYTVRPIGPLIAGLVQQLALGAPLVVAGVVKAGYDLTLWGWARHLGLTSRTRARPPGAAVTASSEESP